MGNLDGHVAIVTGAARGIGAGIALEIAARGAHLALMGRNVPALEETAERIRRQTSAQVSVHAGDVSKEECAERVIGDVFKRFGKIDVLVNNAGIVDSTVFLDIELAGWSSVIAINLTGVFLMTQRAARCMRSGGGGAVVNICSIDAYGTDGPGASYSAAKAGLLGLTKAAATELASINVRVNSVSPGWVRTQMVEEFVSPNALKHMLGNFERVPMRRLVEIPEVARAVAFLAGPESSAITGIDLPVDCGTLSTLFVYESLPK